VQLVEVYAVHLEPPEAPLGVPSMWQCHKGIQRASGTLVAPSVSAVEELHALLRERRSKCPGAVQVLVYQNEWSSIETRIKAKRSSAG
jgi:hypothetical protein